ncbi:MAG TPA: hypothetical protein PLL87_10670 [Syntrophorhabdaceae bacterium]|jgi:hypothetical protein|nr:hypothetical protein [Syntrophorhabdaceae bacterium]HOG40883.1 hypothetical protein [Syntrophorhabdaceae bacterium]
MEGYFYCLCEKGRLLFIRKAKGSRIQGFKDSSGEKRLSLAEPAENAEKDEIDLWPEFRD